MINKTVHSANTNHFTYILIKLTPIAWETVPLIDINLYKAIKISKITKMLIKVYKNRDNNMEINKNIQQFNRINKRN